MRTTDRTFAAHLMNSGYDLSKPVDYNGPQWIYEFDIEEEEYHAQLSYYRKAGLSNFHKICTALAIAGKGYEIKPPILQEWPTLVMAQREVVL